MWLEGAGIVTSAGILSLLRCDIVGAFACLLRLADAVTVSLGAHCSHESCPVVEITGVSAHFVFAFYSFFLATLSLQSHFLECHPLNFGGHERMGPTAGDMDFGGHPLLTMLFFAS